MSASVSQDINEIRKRLRRARSFGMSEFWRVTDKDMIPYSLMIKPALQISNNNEEALKHLVRQYFDGAMRTREILRRLEGKIRIIAPKDEYFEVNAWSTDENTIQIIARFPESIRGIDRRSEVEPLYIVIDGDKILVGTRVHYKTMLWREVDHADIYISPISHTPVLVNAEPATEIDPARYMWIKINQASGYIMQTLGRVYRLRDGKLVSGDHEIAIKISPFFAKVDKRHDLPGFMRAIRDSVFLGSSG
jgi:hypothetical protein